MTSLTVGNVEFPYLIISSSNKSRARNNMLEVTSRILTTPYRSSSKAVSKNRNRGFNFLSSNYDGQTAGRIYSPLRARVKLGVVEHFVHT